MAGSWDLWPIQSHVYAKLSPALEYKHMGT